MIIPHTLAKLSNFRHRMNNHINASCHGTSTDKFDNHVFKFNNKNKSVAKEHYFKFMLFWQSIMKLNYYVRNLTYIKWHLILWIQQTGNCFTSIPAAVYIKMICIIEALHYRRNLETHLG